MRRLFFGFLFSVVIGLQAQVKQFNFQFEHPNCVYELNKEFKLRNRNNTLLRKMPGVSKSNPFYSLKLDPVKDKKILDFLENESCILNLEVVPKTTFASSLPPNDTLYPVQWSLPFINAEEAWALRDQKDTILIGIVDTGTDFNHPDLQNYYTNILDPINGVDDDGNGFVDDYRGWDFGDEDNEAQIAIGIGLDHGVQMTSLAAAPTDNSHGIASAGRYVKYLPIKISDSQGVIGDPYEGVAYAIAMGCDIVNCSWTQQVITNYGKSVIAHAKENDVLVVGAAGNFNNTSATYPCSHPDVLCVGAINESGNKTNTSSFGNWIDIASPGLNLWAAKPEGGYGISGGTSSACAFTSGAAAWLLSVFPEESSITIRDRILNAAKENTNLSVEFEGKMGVGLLNIFSSQEYQSSELSDFIVWPNPSNGEINLQFRLNKLENYKLYLFDLLGREMVQRNLNNLQLGDNQLNFKWAVKSGAYYLILKAENSFFLQEIIIEN